MEARRCIGTPETLINDSMKGCRWGFLSPVPHPSSPHPALSSPNPYPFLYPIPSLSPPSSPFLDPSYSSSPPLLSPLLTPPSSFLTEFQISLVQGPSLLGPKKASLGVNPAQPRPKPEQNCSLFPLPTQNRPKPASPRKIPPSLPAIVQARHTQRTGG